MLGRRSILAGLLGDVLTGKDRTSTLQALGILRPQVRPADALREALDRIERRRLLLISSDDRYGSCEICASDLGEAVLEQLPWADRCPLHAAS